MDIAVRGSDVWFTERAANAIGHIDADGKLYEIPVPTPSSQPFGISIAPDRSVWFSEYSANKVCRLQNGRIVEFPIPTKMSRPEGIAAVDDGAWFAENGAGQIGRIFNNGTFREIALPGHSSPVTVRVDGQQNVWFTDPDSRVLGKIAHDSIVVSTVPITVPASSQGFAPSGDYRPNGLAVVNGARLITTSLGDVVLIDRDNQSVRMIDIATNNSYPYGIGATSADDFWYSNFELSEVTHHVNGSASHFKLAQVQCRPRYPSQAAGDTCAAMPAGVAVDTNGDAWIAEFNGNAIVRLAPNGDQRRYPLGPLPANPDRPHLPVTASIPSLQRLVQDRIKHVVFVVQENRSFDGLFAGFPGADAPLIGLLDRGQVPLMPGTLRERGDPGHTHANFVSDLNNGAMDGFYDQNYHGPANHAYKFVPLTEAQPYWKLAQTYALADRFFEPITGPSYAAHLYVVAGQTGGIVDLPSGAGCVADPGGTVPILGEDGADAVGPYPCFSNLTFADMMDYSGVSWRYYLTGRFDLWDPLTSYRDIGTSSEYNDKVVGPSTKFISDVKSGNLARFSWVIPAAESSDHPGKQASSIDGPLWICDVVNAIGTSKYWDDTAIFIIWDDWGGFYDNVVPPRVDVDGYGFRVPLIAISAYAKHGYVSHATHEFGSVLHLSEEALGTLSLNAGDARSDDLLDMFDFSQTPHAYEAIGLTLQRRRVFDLPWGLAYDSIHRRLAITDLGRKNVWFVGTMGNEAGLVRNADRPIRHYISGEPAQVDSRLWDAYAVAFDEASSDFYVADSAHDEIVRMSGDSANDFAGVVGNSGANTDGVGDLRSAMFNYPTALAVGRHGTIFVSDTANRRIKKISGGLVSNFAGNGRSGPREGRGPADSFGQIMGLAYDSRHAMLYAADFLNNKIWRIDSAGAISTFAGSADQGDRDGHSADARFFGPTGIAFDTTNGFLYVADSGNNKIRAISRSGDVTTLAGGGPMSSSDGHRASAHFFRPTGIAYDPDENVLWVVDSGSATIRHVAIDGTVTTLPVKCYDAPVVCWDSTR